MRRRRRSLRAYLLPKAEMVGSSWMRRSLALLPGSISRFGRREAIGLLRVQGPVHLFRRVDMLLVTLVLGGARPHTGARLVDGDEVNPLPLPDEVARSRAPFAETPLLRLVHHTSPPAFYTILQGYPSVSFPRTRRTSPCCSHFYDQSISLSSRPLLHSPSCFTYYFTFLLTFYQSLDSLYLCTFLAHPLFVHVLSSHLNIEG
jgi:hypothetical protein